MDNNTFDTSSGTLTASTQSESFLNPYGFNSNRFGDANVIIGGSSSTLTGIDGADLFILTDAGATISNFQVGTDKLGIISDETLTFLDIVNPFLPGGIAQTDIGAVVRTPNGITRTDFVSLTGVDAAQLANSPDSFAIISPGNVAIDWNAITFDVGRIGGVPPAASTRYFALESAAVNDAIQGILQTPGRSTYLESIGITLPSVTSGASAEAAAASAARQVLTSLFEDPDNPVSRTTFSPIAGSSFNKADYLFRVFDAAYESSLAEINASPDAIASGVEFGKQVAQALLDLRANDGAFRNADGTPVNFAEFNNIYQDGIEPNDALNEPTGQDVPSKLLNDGTVGRLSDGTILTGSEVPANTISADGTATNSIAKTTPGAWRRAEDTLRADGTYSPLASPEFADINQTWVLPSTSFFNDNVLPPPALDSQRYRDNVAEVKEVGSLNDLAGVGEVSVLNRTETIDGVTRYIGRSNNGTAFNGTDPSDDPYNDFGRIGGDGLGLTSAERTTIAHVWANAGGSYGPNYAWQNVTQQLAINNNSSLADTAYIFANLNVALADGFANIWDIKWDEDYFWRPVSSIRNADQLESTAALDDNGWTPREVTPQHPCHPSGTSITAGLSSTILANFYGDNQTFTVSADPHPNSARLLNALESVNGNDLVNGVHLDEVSRTYTSLYEAADESRTSRIYAGAHFRFATENGINLGEQVATYFLRHNPFTTRQTTSGSGRTV